MLSFQSFFLNNLSFFGTHLHIFSDLHDGIYKNFMISLKMP